MERKFFTLFLVVALGVLLGVGIVSKKTKDPLFRQLIQQQSEILKSQERIEKQLSGSPSGVDSGISSRQQQLEQRIALLEAQLKLLAGGNVNMPGAVQRPQPQMPPQEDLSKVYSIEVAHTPVLGKKDAPVTLVEFIDFQCPFCSRFHEPLMEAAKAYPDKVNVMVKNFPLSFHPQAKPAAKAAFAAGEQGKYFEMVDLLLQNASSLSDETFQKLAKQLKLNEKKFLDDYKTRDADWEQLINKDVELGMQSDVRGTPTFFINGRKTTARDVAGLKAEIEKILTNK